MAILREERPDLRVRVVNVGDLMSPQPESEHPHGMPDPEFERAVQAGPAVRLDRVPGLGARSAHHRRPG